ncbi:MAG: hypothetical protein ABSF97_07330 [Candidatus Sulfotelmatobacter sp.]|jgi:hypothetical protein
MDHFSEQSWSDFVRGVSAAEISGNIRTHLSTGCPKCKTDIDVWSQIRKLASEEAAFTPPENLVHLVKVGFAGREPQPKKRTLANIIFDSFAQPLPAGVRSGGPNIWQVICEAEGLMVDLRFGRRAHGKVVQLTGQVLDKQAVQPRQNVAVDLSTDEDQLLGTTVANAFGEFQMEFEAKEFVWLSITAGSRNTVWVPLTILR